MTKKNYERPSVEVIMVNIEKGFAGSVPVSNTYADEGAAGMLQEGAMYNW